MTAVVLVAAAVIAGAAYWSRVVAHDEGATTVLPTFGQRTVEAVWLALAIASALGAAATLLGLGS